MERILKDLDVDYTVGIDEAAFYGPKLDIQYKNVYGKEDTSSPSRSTCCSPSALGVLHRRKRREEAKVHHPLHVFAATTHARLISSRSMPRAADVDGARAGALPARHRTAAADYCAEQAGKKLEDMGFRVEVDYRNEKIGRKIRDAQMEKVPTWWSSVITWRTAPLPGRHARRRPGAMSMDEFRASSRSDNKEKEVATTHGFCIISM